MSYLHNNASQTFVVGQNYFSNSHFEVTKFILKSLSEGRERPAKVMNYKIDDKAYTTFTYNII